MIEFINLTLFDYIGWRRLPILKDVNFNFETGERIAIFSTQRNDVAKFLRLLSIAQPDVGQIVRKGNISWPVGSLHGLDLRLTMKQNIRFISRLFSKKFSELEEFILEFTDLQDSYNRPLRSLTNDLRTRFALSLPLGFEFDCWLLERTRTAGDPRFEARFNAVLEQKTKDRTVIGAARTLKEFQSHFTSAVLIDQGKLRYIDTAEEIRFFLAAVRGAASNISAANPIAT